MYIANQRGSDPRKLGRFEVTPSKNLVQFFHTVLPSGNLEHGNGQQLIDSYSVTHRTTMFIEHDSTLWNIYESTMVIIREKHQKKIKMNQKK